MVFRYLETGTSPYGLRPWIWIVVLTAGPAVAAIFSVWYMYINVGTARLLHCLYLTYLLDYLQCGTQRDVHISGFPACSAYTV